MSQPVGVLVLQDALTLLSDPSAWTQHTLRQERPLPIMNRLRRTVPAGFVRMARCIDGALEDAAHKYGGTDAHNMARRLVYPHLPGAAAPASIHEWNDAPGRRHEEVVGLLKRARRAAA